MEEHGTTVMGTTAIGGIAMASQLLGTNDDIAKLWHDVG